MRLTVTRGSGASPAPEELTLELACSQAPATQAGRNYLDETGQDTAEMELACRPPTSVGVVLPGSVVAVDDPKTYASWRGLVTGFSVALAVDASGAAAITQTLVVDRPLYG
jgi:hypothetical protein